MQYFFDDFWNFQNFVKIWTRNPPNYCQFTLKNTRKILEHPWKIWILEIWESENLKISGSPVYQTSRFFYFRNLRFVFVCFCFFFWSYDMIIWWNDEKSKMRNFLRFILPAEFLEKLGYEFSFEQKTWIDFSKKWTIFLFSGKVIPIINQH